MPTTNSIGLKSIRDSFERNIKNAKSYKVPIIMKCSICKIELDESTAYEYRGAIACAEHHGQMIERRDFERNEIIREESAKTEVFKGLDLGDSSVGKANREILSRQIEIAGKESAKLRKYEGR